MLDRQGLETVRAGSRNIDATSRALRSMATKTPVQIRPALQTGARALKRFSRTLDRRIQLLDTYQPFIHDRSYDFEVRNLGEVVVYDPEWRSQTASICWEEYWTKIHLPGMRRWCFPKVESALEENAA